MPQLDMGFALRMDDKQKPDDTEQDLDDSRRLVSFLFTSEVWSRYLKRGIPVNFEVFKKQAACILGLEKEEFDRLLTIAFAKEWIILYGFSRSGRSLNGIREGKNVDEALQNVTVSRQRKSR
jgi:hypothetical protein